MHEYAGPIGEGRGQAPPFRGIAVLIISVIMTTGVAQQLPARILAGAGAGASGAQAIRSPPDPPPEGGRGARTPICIDTYGRCVFKPGFVDCGSTFLCVTASCGQFASDVCI